MIRPFHALGHATRLWWREWIGMIFLNLLWVLLLIPIVTGPPATAALYAITKRVYDEETWELQDTWHFLRDLFWPSWRWALPNILIFLVLTSNLLIYSGAEGFLWVVLRVTWGLVLLIWLILNLYFWPFWLAQEDKSLRTTYANCGRFLLMNPWPSLIVSIVCAGVLAVSVIFVFPLLIGAVAWIALVGVTSVQRSLAQRREDL